MSVDVSHRRFLLFASTFIERVVDAANSAERSLPKELMPKSYLKEWIRRLEILASDLIPENEAQDEMRTMCLGILNASRRLVEEILTWNVVHLYQSQCQNGLMLGFFISSTMRTLALIEQNVTLTIAGNGCDGSGCDCLQDLKEEWSEVQADSNSIRLYLLVVFLQKNELRLPKRLIVEMIDYALTNYRSHCPTIYREALNALRLGEKFTFPITIHFMPR